METKIDSLLFIRQHKNNCGFEKLSCNDAVPTLIGSEKMKF